MKKIMQTFLFIIMMLVYIYPANALTEFSIDSWTTSGGYGNLSRVNDKVINIKGNDSASDGMYVGPFSKASTAKLVDGITEETYIELGLNKMKTGEYFEVSLALKDSSNTYVSEAVVMTQKVDDNTIKLSAGWADNVIATISKEGLYTYQWKIFTQGEKTYVNFSLLDGKTVVGTTGNIDMDSSKLTTNDTKNPIAKQSDVSVKYLWFCNVNVQNGINVHISLPEVKPTFDGLLANSNSENLSSVLHNSLLNDSKFAELAKNTDLTVDIEAKEVTVDNEVKEKFESFLSEKVSNANILEYLDIDILVKNLIDGASIGNLTNLTEAIDLVVSLPENLPEVKEGYNRTYYIVRQHNDDIELLDTTLTEDGKGLTFKSDKFSTYAIAYIDTKIEANPNTADINLMTLIGMILVGLVGIIYTMKNRLFN